MIFKIQRLDYKVVKIEGIRCEQCVRRIQAALEQVKGVESVNVRQDKKWAEVFVQKEAAPADQTLKDAVERCGEYAVSTIDLFSQSCSKIDLSILHPPLSGHSPDRDESDEGGFFRCEDRGHPARFSLAFPDDNSVLYTYR